MLTTGRTSCRVGKTVTVLATVRRHHMQIYTGLHPTQQICTIPTATHYTTPRKIWPQCGLLSQNSHLRDKFLQRTPVPNFMEIEQADRRRYQTGGRGVLTGFLFSNRPKSSHLMLYREIIAVCSKIHTKHINTAVWAERRIAEC